MSLITRCPACGTMFNVVADQLKVSQGWVRCGHCANVFDATLHLQDEGPLLAPNALNAATHDGLALAAKSADEENISYAQEVTEALKTPGDVAASPSDQTAVHQAAEAVEVNQLQIADARDDVSSEVPSDGQSDVSFVRDARRQAFWRKPLVRAGLSLLALLLLGLLVLQVAVMQRDSLAAAEPRLKPVLQMLCQPLSCNVSPLRQIEAVVIDSSAFNKLNDSGMYRLTFTFKNTGTVAVAMPSLEVTLTDTQDQPVLRRVLTTAQLGAVNSMLAASAEFSGALNLQVAATTAPPDNTSPNVLGRVAGYRLLAFYP